MKSLLGMLAFLAWSVATALLLLVFLIRLVIALLTGDVGELASTLARVWPAGLAFYAGSIVALFVVFLLCAFLSSLSRQENGIGDPKRWQDYSRNLFEKDRRHRAKRRHENQ